MPSYLLALAVIAFSLAAQKILNFWRLTKAVKYVTGSQTLVLSHMLGLC